MINGLVLFGKILTGNHGILHIYIYILRYMYDNMFYILR